MIIKVDIPMFIIEVSKAMHFLNGFSEYSLIATNSNINYISNNIKFDKYESDNFSLLVFGYISSYDELEFKNNVELLFGNNLPSLLRKLNGEFLIIAYNKYLNKLIIINDRWASIPVFYTKIEGSFLLSHNYFDLCSLLSKSKKLKFDKNIIFEYLSFRRIFGSDTYQEDIKFLDAASILEFSFDGSISTTKYWTPNYAKNKASKAQLSQELADKVKQSFQRKSSDDKRYGIFLSGGLDTRLVLASADKPLTAFTLSANKEGNREYQVAYNLAKIKGVEHRHLQLSDDHFEKIYPSAIKQAGCMYEPNSIFMGFKEEILRYSNIAFHGHGFDYMFQGMYLPSKNVVISGRKLRWRKLRVIDDDIVADYIKNISYRIKFDFRKYIHADFKEKLEDYLYSRIEYLVKEGQCYTNDPYDLWYYITFHNPSRHYSYPDHASIATNIEQRTVSFDNDLYDFYLSLPAHRRFDAVLQRRAIVLLNKEFAKVVSANDGYPVCSSYMKTYYQLKDSIVSRIVKPKNSQLDHHIRTWPTHEWIIRNSVFFKEKVLAINAYSHLSCIEWLNLDLLQKDIKVWLDKPKDKITYNDRFADFIWLLMGMNTFLELL